MKKFVPESHAIWDLLIPVCVAASLIIPFIGAIGAMLELGSTFVACVKLFLKLFLLISLSSIPFFLLHKYNITRGLIVDGETLIYKGLWKRKILPQDIVAIKITRAITQPEYGAPINMTDKDGNQLYTMFLLKGYMPWTMNEVEGTELTSDGTFHACYGEYAFCSVVYDQEVIDHLLRLNPNIVIC